VSFRFALGAGYASQLQTECHVRQHILPRQQRVVLKHHTAFGARSFDWHVIERYASGAGLDEASDQVQQ
jgi:hypothetical protein